MKNYIIYISILLASLSSQEHFNLSIDETGESTLFIFQNSINNLNVNDELGLFDSLGIINDNGDIGEVLVGSGIWNGSQLEIVTITSVDLSDFGGPILPGAYSGNPMVLKIWDSSQETTYNMNYYISTGSGNFNGLFTVISEISLASECDVANCGCMDIQACNYDSNADVDDGSCSYPNENFGECDCNGNIFDCNGDCGGVAIIDNCGVCDGLGAIYDCGCYDILDGDCDCVGNILDECGVCGGDNSSCSDCYGVPNGGALLDDCGVCNGDNSSCSDCNGTPNGNALIDNCGICDGDNSSCDNPEAVLSFYDMGGVILTNLVLSVAENENICLNDIILSSVTATELDLYVADCISIVQGSHQIAIFLKSTQPISGFQFNVTGGIITDAYGGAAEDAGFTVSTSSTTVLGFSFSGSSIEPSGDFYGCLELNACNYDSNATVSDDSCQYPDQGFDCQGNCLNEDCNGECGGDAIVDECGICEGLGPIYECDDGTFACDELSCDDNDGGGGDGGGGLGGECEDGEILDCFGNCALISWLGDGYCDESIIDFNCLALSYDMGDCGIDFTNHVMPIINANCTGYCHNGVANYQGGLNLESYSGLMDGGNSGLAVQPFYPDYSLIIQKLNGIASGEQMPLGGDSLPDNYINTIYYWIEQGASGPDDGGEDVCIEEGEVEDCDGNCVDEILLGNNNCDDGEEGEANFNCSQFIFDDADCPVGILEFGDYTFNNIDGSGTVEILMNCEFPVSNFDIEVSGLEISGLYGGTSEIANFNLSYTSSTIEGSSSASLLYIAPNSGLLTVINFDSISPEVTEICFSNSTITTSAGYEYNAILGDCLEIDMLGDFLFIPNQITIDNIYPNPFNPITTITYTVSSNQNIIINIYDLNGKIIKHLINRFHGIGKYAIDWDAAMLPTGVYIVELKGDTEIITEKITLLK